MGSRIKCTNTDSEAIELKRVRNMLDVNVLPFICIYISITNYIDGIIYMCVHIMCERW